MKLASAALPRRPAHRRRRRAARRSATSSWSSSCSSAAQKTGIGAQFGGKYFALDVRVVRLPRHGASCPVGMGVSCSAHRNIKAQIDRDGIWLEELERDPGALHPREVPRRKHEHDAVQIDLNRPMKEILAELSQAPGHHRRSR